MSPGMHVMLDSTYTKVKTLPPLEWSRSGINGHEFTIFDNGQRALTFLSRDRSFNETTAASHSLVILGTDTDIVAGHYQDNCIVERHIGSGEAEFEWCALDNGISPLESLDSVNSPAQSFGWDYL